MKNFVIALDGPAASGKGTLAKQLAEHYGLAYLDTGLTYRAVAKALLDAGLSLDDEKLAASYAEKIDLNALNKEQLSSHHLGQAASKIAIFPLLRQMLVKQQKLFAENPQGAILDGRDIGTVVCPRAAIKIFIVADAKVRAQRRYEEMLRKGEAADYAQILKQLEERDRRDQMRAEGALKPAQDAHLLDTTKLSIKQCFDSARTLIDPLWEQSGKQKVIQ